MDLIILISSIILSLAFMWVQSLYWEIRYRVWITTALIIGLITTATVNWITSWVPGLGLFSQILIECGLISLITVAAVLTWFFRDPERVPPEKDGIILCPADGKIIYVKEVENESHFVSIKAGTRNSLE